MLRKLKEGNGLSVRLKISSFFSGSDSELVTHERPLAGSSFATLLIFPFRIILTASPPCNEYKRCGTANVFSAVEPQAGNHFTFPTPDRSAPELARVLNRIIGSYPFARTIHLVMDNLNIPDRKTLTDYFGEEEGAYLWNRLSVHYTPKHGSWLNQAEIEITLFARQCLGKRRIPSLVLLQREAHAWNRKINRDKTTIDSRFSRKKARQKFGYE